MSRASHCLTLAAGAAAVLALSALVAPPALAQTQVLAQTPAERSQHAGHRHQHRNADRRDAVNRDAVLAWDPRTTVYEVVTSPFYGPAAAYLDAHAAWLYPGPNERHYFGYGW